MKLNLSISCFIMVSLNGKVIVKVISFTDVFIAVTTNIHNKVLFNIECLRTFFLSLQQYLLFLDHY